MTSYKSRVNFNDTSTIIQSLVWISLLVMSFGTLLSAYLKQGYSETISFFVQDGWCKSGSQGIGIHCFGDLYAPMTVASNVNPWSNDLNLAYTPISFYYFKILNSGLLSDLSTYASLAVNLSLTLFALMLPGLYIIKNQKDFESVSGKMVLLLSLTSAPSLIMIDRGSSSFLVFPAVFFFYLGIQKANLNMATYSLIVMALWKPQSIILCIGILIYFGVKQFIRASAILGIIFLSSFLLYPVGLLNNISDYLANSRDYQNYVPIPTPGNYSLINFVGFLNGSLKSAMNGFTNLQESFRPPLDREFVNGFSFSYAIMVVLLLYTSRKSISKVQFILYSSFFLMTIAGTTFGYYLTLMLIPLFVITMRDLSTHLSSTKNRAIWWFYVMFLFFTVPAWPINWGNLPLNINESWVSLGVQWTIVHGIISLLVIFALIDLCLHSSSSFKNNRRISHE